MSVKVFKATTSTLRGTRLEDRSDLVKDAPPKSLTVAKRKRGGRNNQGKVTVRHRGGGVKRRVRIVDFKREKDGIEAKVEGIYFDPNRSANLALLQYSDGEKRFILAPRDLNVGDVVVSGEDVDLKVGNSMPLEKIPSGTVIHAVENVPGKGAVFGRSAGIGIIVRGIDPTGKYVQLKMPSGEIRLVNKKCRATIGQVGNEEKMNVKLGKAGRKRKLGWRPVVRGMAMNPHDHPHGGGEGKGVVGRAKDKWGHRIGTRTRKNKRTWKFIVKRRRTKRRPYAKK